MALPTPQPLNERVVSTYMADSSGPGSAFAVAPCKGRIVRMYSVLFNAITVANTVITSKINGTAVTGGGWTIAFTGSAAGTVGTGTPTGANTVNAGDAIEIISDGGATTTAPTMFYIVIRMDV